MGIETLGDKRHIMTHSLDFARYWGNSNVNYYDEQGMESFLLSYSTNNISRLKAQKKINYQFKKMNAISNGLYLNTFRKLDRGEFE